MLRGADVSRYQGTIDWNAFAPHNDFVFIRATRGASNIDQQFERNRSEAARTGVLRGYYHFAVPAEDALAQARHFCATLGDLAPGEIDPVLDIEWTQYGEKPDRPWTAQDTASLKAWVRAFVGEVRGRYPGRGLVIYTGYWFWQSYLAATDEFKDLPLWIAAYTRGLDPVASRPPSDTRQWGTWALEKPIKRWSPWSKWTLWQFSSRAVIPGVTVNSVDANLFDGTLEDLRRLAGLAPAPPVVTTKPTADALCTLLLSKAGTEYVFGYEVRPNDPDPPAFDCSELVEWAGAQLGVTPKVPDGTWNQARHVKDAGLLIPVEEAIRTRGALLFRFDGDPFTAQPTSRHVAVSLGDGRTIEARDAAHDVGVFPALDRGWTHAGKLPGIDYPATPSGGAIRRDARGPEVLAWQHHLLQWRPTILPRYGADGHFGGETEAATRMFQREAGLEPNGVVDPETREALQRALDAKLQPSRETRKIVVVEDRSGAAEDGLLKLYPKLFGEGTAVLRIPPGSTEPPEPALLGPGSFGLGTRIQGDFKQYTGSDQYDTLRLALAGEGIVSAQPERLPPPGRARSAPSRAQTTMTVPGSPDGRFTITVLMTPAAVEDGGAVDTPPASAAPRPRPRAVPAASPAPAGGAGLEALPPRRPDAKTGTQLYEAARDLDVAAREALLVEQILAGNVPGFLRRFVEIVVRVPHLDVEGIVRVAPDYLAVGSDDDFLRVPMTAPTAQRIADACGCILPTPRLVDLIYANARRQTAVLLSDAGDPASVARFREHDRRIAEALAGKVGELLAGHKKDIVITKRLAQAPGRLAIYGLHRADGRVLQPLGRTLQHADDYVDHTHGVRLVDATMRIDGESRRIADVLVDPALCDLVSSEGVCPVHRYESGAAAD